MIPIGYMAKRIFKRPEHLLAPSVTDICSVSKCISEDFGEYIKFWKHNGYWFFNSPEVIRATASENSIRLEGTSLFYYEAYELEFDDENWKEYKPELSFKTEVIAPQEKELKGFDVVTFSCGTSPECSPLSCNDLAKEIPTNSHCLFASFQEAETSLKNGTFKDCEPGPYRIFAVYSVDWPELSTNSRLAPG
jgi:hypothetical protein